MEPQALHYVLVGDWARIENTPLAERKPLVVQRWHRRADHLAALLERQAPQLVAEIQAEGLRVAVRQRQATLRDLAHDLAVANALGEPIPPPWQRRLQRLVAVMDAPLQSIRERVESEAARVSVMVMT